jgi:hypothetical protein
MNEHAFRKKNLKIFENKKKKKTMNLNFPGFRVERQILMQLGNSARANRGGEGLIQIWSD